MMKSAQIAQEPLLVEGCDQAVSGSGEFLNQQFMDQVLESVKADLLNYLGGTESKQTQGLFEAVTSLTTTIMGAAGWYWLYSTFDRVSTTLENSHEHIAKFLSNLVTYIEPLMFVSSVALAYYKGAIGAGMVTTIITGYLTAKFASIMWKNGIPLIVMAVLHGVSEQSTAGDRHAQAASPVSFVGALFALGVAFATVHGHLNNSAKVLTTAFKTIGVSLLAFKTLEEVLFGFFERMPDFVLLLIADKCPSLALYIRLKSDPSLKALLEELAVIKVMPDVELCYNSHNCARFIECYERVQHLVEHEPVFTRILDETRPDIFKYLDEKHLMLRRMGLWPGSRKQPFVIWLEGTPGIGKSTIVRVLADRLLKELIGDSYDDDYERYTYFMNTSLPFMDGYHNQPITVINDYLQFGTTEEESLLIKATDTTDWYLNVSSVDNPLTGIKGEVRFTSRIIIITSNVRGLINSRSGAITNNEAFNRRRDVCLSFRMRKGHNMRSVMVAGPWDYHWVDFVPFDRADPFILGDALTNDAEEPLRPFFEVIVRRMREFINIGERFFTPPSRRETLRSKIDRRQLALEGSQDMENTLWNRSKNFLNQTIFGVPLYAWSVLLVTGSTAFYLYKTSIKSLLEKTIQSASGDENTMFVKRPFKRVRPVVKETQSKEINLDEFVYSLQRNMVKIITVIPTPDKVRTSMTVYGIFITGNIILVPSHVFRRGSSVYNNSCMCDVTKVDGTLIATQVAESNVHLTEEDIAFIVLPERGLEIRKNIIKHFIKDDTIVRDLEPAMVIRYLVQSTITTPVQVYYSESTEYHDAWGCNYHIPTWEYNTTFSVGDCGSPLMLTSSDQQLRLCGLHVAGDSSSGSACVITQEYLLGKLANLSTTKVTQGEVQEIWYDAEEDMETDLLLVGYSSRVVYQNTRSDIIPAPFYGLLQEPITGPAVLRPGDPRLLEPVSPAFEALRGFAAPVSPVSTSYDYITQNILLSIYKTIRPYKLIVPDLINNINSTHFYTLDKLKLDTSPGYPHIVNRRTKKDFFKMDDKGYITPTPMGVELCEKADRQLKDLTFDYINVCSLKDERVSLEKIQKGKTRAFIIPPVEATVMVRKYFGDFIDKEITLGLDASTTVGVNPYSREWDRFYKMMKKPYLGDIPMEYFIDGDFPSFDKKMQLPAMLAYARLVSDFYDDEYEPIRQHIMVLNAHSRIIFGRKIYQKKQGNCSGFAATTSLNSFECKRRPIQCMLEKLPPEKTNEDYVLRNCRIVTHGDDHIIAVSADLFKYFNGLVYKEWCDEHGFGYTASIKGSEIVAGKKLEECFYLKNYFRYDLHDRVWKACLKKEVIQEMVSWQHRCSSADQVYISQAILQSAQKYAWFWGEEYFSEITRALKQAVKAKRFNITLLTYENIHNMYQGNAELFSWFERNF